MDPKDTKRKIKKRKKNISLGIHPIHNFSMINSRPFLTSLEASPKF